MSLIYHSVTLSHPFFFCQVYHWDEFHRSHSDLASFARDAESRWMALPVVAEDADSARKLLQQQRQLMEDLEGQRPLLGKIEAEVRDRQRPLLVEKQAEVRFG